MDKEVRFDEYKAATVGMFVHHHIRLGTGDAQVTVSVPISKELAGSNPSSTADSLCDLG